LKKPKIRIAVLGIVGVPANYGGFESLIENLLDQNYENYQYTIFCSSKVYTNRRGFYKGAHLKYISFDANGFSSILYDGISLLKCVGKNYDLILLLGISGAIFLPFIKPFLKAKLICNVDGIEWKREKWSTITKSFLKFSELLAIKFSDQIIADNKGISDYIHSKYKVKATFIAYGAETFNVSSSLSLSKYNLKKGEFFFKVCRIEPENNIEKILIAFSELNNDTLVIVGNWERSKFGIKMKRLFQGYSNLILLDPIYDYTSLNELRGNCKGYIHGHSAGGTNPSLVEAMSLKVPIIAFDVDFNRYTLNNNGVFFKTVDDLKSIINEFDSRDFTVEVQKIYTTFINNYTKIKIAKEYEKLFEALLNRGRVGF
jgi:glycosyltransferase involved in cell wall biosynthesis